MTKQEIEKLKKDIKEEVKQEILAEFKIEKTNKLKNKTFNFEKYKVEVVVDDIKKVQNFINKNEWYWYVPIIGFIIYMYQLNQCLTSIDRGILRKKINYASLSWLYVDIPFFYVFQIPIIFNYFPFRTRAVLKKAIKLTQENIE